MYRDILNGTESKMPNIFLKLDLNRWKRVDNYQGGKVYGSGS